MRKSLWIIALLFAALCAPNARADSFDASFTCSGSCVSVPTDPPVLFPSPTIPVAFFSQTFTITLNGSDTPTDAYTWGVGSTSGSWYFVIEDITTGTSDAGPSFALGALGIPGGTGSVDFTAVVTPNAVGAPEPSSGALLLVGLGIVVFVVRKHMGRGLPLAT